MPKILFCLFLTIISTVAHSASEFRGINITLHKSVLSDLDYAASNKVNLIRLVMHADNHSDKLWRSIIDADGNFKRTQIEKLHSYFLKSEDLGIKVILDIHSWPCREVGSFWNSNQCQQRYLNLLEQLAVKFDKYNSMLGYDLMNEPDYVKKLFSHSDKKSIRKNKKLTIPVSWSKTSRDYFYLIDRAIIAIRKHSNKRVYVQSPIFYSNPSFWDLMEPVTEKNNICYSFHMYHPFKFTHQHKFKSKSDHISYPNNKFTKEVLNRYVQPVIGFQKRTNSSCVFVGEFGVLSSTEQNGGDRWLTDVIDIFEANNWDWAYWSLSIKQRNPFLCLQLTPSGKELYYQCNINRRRDVLKSAWAKSFQ